MSNNFCSHKYRLKEKIGKGSFGEIHICENRSTGERFACKIESADADYPQLHREYKIYRELEGEKHIPHVYDYCTENGKNYLVMDLMGPSLKDHYKKCSGHLSLKTIMMLGIEMISCVQVFHKHGYIHRDMKPENFLTGVGINENEIYIIDYGLAKKYRSSDGEHLPFRDGKSFAGTARYGSINALMGQQQSRRDDLEAIGYVLIFLYKGVLPWIDITCSSRTQKHKKIAQSKMRNKVETLCYGMPKEFIKYMEEVKGYTYLEEPKYNHLKDLLNKALINLHAVNDLCWDWTTKKSKHYIETLNDDDLQTKSYSYSSSYSYSYSYSYNRNYNKSKRNVLKLKEKPRDLIRIGEYEKPKHANIDRYKRDSRPIGDTIKHVGKQGYADHDICIEKFRRSKFAEEKPKHKERSSFIDEPPKYKERPRYAEEKPTYKEKSRFIDTTPRYSNDRFRIESKRTNADKVNKRNISRSKYLEMEENKNKDKIRESEKERKLNQFLQRRGMKVSIPERFLR